MCTSPDAALGHGERCDYVVELAVTGIAIVHVTASSPLDARELAVACVRPCDVTELDERTIRRGVVIGHGRTRSLADLLAGDAETPSAGPGDDGQA